MGRLQTIFHFIPEWRVLVHEHRLKWAGRLTPPLTGPVGCVHIMAGHLSTEDSGGESKCLCSYPAAARQKRTAGWTSDTRRPAAFYHLSGLLGSNMEDFTIHGTLSPFIPTVCAVGACFKMSWRYKWEENAIEQALMHQSPLK